MGGVIECHELVTIVCVVRMRVSRIRDSRLLSVKAGQRLGGQLDALARYLSIHLFCSYSHLYGAEVVQCQKPQQYCTVTRGTSVYYSDKLSKLHRGNGRHNHQFIVEYRGPFHPGRVWLLRGMTRI